VGESIDAVAKCLAALEISIADPPLRFEALGAIKPSAPILASETFSAPIAVPTRLSLAAPTAESFYPVPETLLRAAPPPKAIVKPLPARCEIERLALRTLGDPGRSRPLREMAERLRRDLEQTSSKTCLLVAAGQATRTHEAAFYAAALLAQERHESVLLVDADFSRRTLSESLQRKMDPGFSELLASRPLTGEPWRPTAIEKVSFLPAGKVSPSDLADLAVRVPEVFDRLTGEFGCLVIDGGTAFGASGGLAGVADATYLVVELGTVEMSAAQAALAQLRQCGARVLGCIAT
jgi:Mrp family chromosome partitioning ATPase